MPDDAAEAPLPDSIAGLALEELECLSRRLPAPEEAGPRVEAPSPQRGEVPAG